MFYLNKSNDKEHQIISLFGIRFKFKTKTKNLRNQMMNKILFETSTLIKPSDKILIVAPHPDDEVIGCGGIIAKYKEQIDVLCINSSGVKYDWNTESEDEIAQIRCDEFYKTMKAAGVKKAWVAKIAGVPPMFNEIEANFDNYLKNFNFKEYDIIFIPHRFDGHREHRYVGNYLVKRLLRCAGYKKTLKIARYEVWGTLSAPNYYENITDFMEAKNKLINTYESRIKGNYAKRIKGLNYYRAIISCNNIDNSYAEAFFIQDVKDYIKERDDKTWRKA